MSGNSIVLLLHDYGVKEVKTHTFKLKHNNNTVKETFDVEKSDGTTIEDLFNTMFSFQTMSSRMNFTGTMMFLTLTSAWWIMHWRNDSWLHHMKTTKHQKIPSFLLRNGCYIASRQRLPYAKRMDDEFNEETFCYEGKRFWK